jgi:hypothetical protein
MMMDVLRTTIRSSRGSHFLDLMMHMKGARRAAFTFQRVRSPKATSSMISSSLLRLFRNKKSSQLEKIAPTNKVIICNMTEGAIPSSAFVRFRAVSPTDVSYMSSDVVMDDCDGGLKQPILFQAQPIPVYARSIYDLDTSTEHHSYYGNTQKKRIRGRGSPFPYRDSSMTAEPGIQQQQQPCGATMKSLSIDLIVSNIVGYLPWREQVLSCRRVSKLWCQAARNAPMRVLLQGSSGVSKKNCMSCLPRVLQPSILDQQLNNMPWKVASNLLLNAVSNQVARLDIYGDGMLGVCSLRQQQENHHGYVLHPVNLPHLEDLQLRHISTRSLNELFPVIDNSSSSSERRGMMRLQKLVIAIQDKGLTARKSHNMLLSGIVKHAPNLQELEIVGLQPTACSLNGLLPLRASLRVLKIIGVSSNQRHPASQNHGNGLQELEWARFRSSMPRLLSWRIDTPTCSLRSST